MNDKVIKSQKRLTQVRVFPRKSFILIHRIIKHLNRTKKRYGQNKRNKKWSQK